MTCESFGLEMGPDFVYLIQSMLNDHVAYIPEI